MKKWVPLLLVLFGCESQWDYYEDYIIPEGNHYSVYRAEALQSPYLQFWAIFDSSAIYQSAIPENQWDINKLFGFSDCNTPHHENSARFGWRWLDNTLEIFAYCYVNGERISEKIGNATLLESQYYEIYLNADAYVFRFQDQLVSIPRAPTCDAGVYYMLHPYFGGDEFAPHTIRIQIKRNY